jgi:hypothetical protein
MMSKVSVAHISLLSTELRGTGGTRAEGKETVSVLKGSTVQELPM